jgi:glycosyltransferase involved in cell wall biosynthesis
VNARRPHLVVLTPSADGYGSDRAVVAALPAMLRSFDVTVIAAVDGPMLDAARATGARVEVTHDFALRRRFFTPQGFVPAAVRVAAALAHLRRVHRRHPIDLVYVNTVAVALLPGLRLAVPAPVVVHVREVPRTSGRLNRVHFGVIDRVATRVVCNSTFTARFVGELTPSLSDRCVIVNDGVQALPAALPPSDDGVLDVVCVGRLHPQKGQSVLIDAAALATKAGHRWRVHLWGDALPEHAEVEAALHEAVARHGLKDVVVFHGYSSDTASMYDSMDVAAIPSTWPEGFSLVTAEAQMASLGAVATGPGGPDDIIVEGVTGRVVGFDDAEALWHALAEAQDPAVRDRWGRAGRERAIERFTVERYSAALVDQLSDVLSA